MSSSKAGQFTLGVNELYGGFRFFRNNRRLWLYAVIPTSINIVVLFLAVYFMIHFYGDIFRWVMDQLGLSQIKEHAGILAHIWVGLVWSIHLILKILLFIILALLILLASYLFGQIIVSPFNDALSEKVEEIITGVKAPQFTLKRFIKNTLRTIKVEALKAVFFFIVPVILLVLIFIPFAGGILYTALTLAFGLWGLGFTYADYPMSRRMWGFKERILFARRNFPAMMGLGIVFIIPFFAFIFTAPMTVAGTRLFLKLNNSLPLD